MVVVVVMVVVAAVAMVIVTLAMFPTLSMPSLLEERKRPVSAPQLTEATNIVWQCLFDRPGGELLDA